MPYTRQTSFGLVARVDADTVMTLDFVRADGRDLNVRPRINVPSTSPTAFAALSPSST